MKNLFNILFLLMAITVSAQVKSGYITYGETIVAPPIDTSLIKDSQAKAFIAQHNSKIQRALASDSELYEMSFNKTESNFKVIPFVENEANPYLNRAVSPGIYYNNIEKNLGLHQIYAYDQNYLINNKSHPHVWKITNESKKIDNYLCYKALTTIKNHLNIETEITAWFAPELPFKFGPKDYGGLPGLILALLERGHYFYAKKIALSNEDGTIKVPNKGKLVSREEFEDIGRKAMQQLKGED